MITNNLKSKLDKTLVLLLKLINSSIKKEDYTNLNPVELNEFLKLVSASRLDSEVYNFINTHKIFNSETDKSLKKIKYQSLVENINTKKIFYDALELAKTLSKNQINYCFLKGIALHSMIYKDYKFRPVRDIDILVAPDDIELAKKIIQSNGYAEKENSIINNDYLFSKLSNSSGTCIEIHSRIIKNRKNFEDCEIANSILKNKIKVYKDDICLYCPDLISLTTHLIYHATLKENFNVGAIFIKDLVSINKIKRIEPYAFKNITTKIGINKITELIFLIIQNYDDLVDMEYDSQFLKKLESGTRRNLIDILDLLIRNPISSQEGILLSRSNLIYYLKLNVKKFEASPDKVMFLKEKSMTLLLSIFGIITKVKFLIKLKKIKNLG